MDSMMKYCTKSLYLVFIWTLTLESLFVGSAYCQNNSSYGDRSGKKEWSRIYSKADNSVVIIDYMDDEIRTVGSGIVVGVKKNGTATILTAYHVVKDYYEKDHN